MLFLVSLTLTFVTVSFFSLFEEGIPSLLPSSLPVLNSRRQPVLDTLLDRYSMFIDESFAYTANISSFSFLTSVSLLKKLELQRLKVACDHRYIQNMMNTQTKFNAYEKTLETESQRAEGNLHSVISNSKERIASRQARAVRLAQVLTDFLAASATKRLHPSK